MSEPDRIRLRPGTLADADLLDAWAASVDARGPFNDFGEPRGRSYRQMLAGGPLLDENHGELVVERLEDRQPIGTIGWHAVWNGPNHESRAWNIGKLHLQSPTSTAAFFERHGYANAGLEKACFGLECNLMWKQLDADPLATDAKSGDTKRKRFCNCSQ